jgi:hypothetical protein
MLMASSGAGSASGLAASQPRPASAGAGGSARIPVERCLQQRDGDLGDLGGRSQPAGGRYGQRVGQVRGQDKPQLRPVQAGRLAGLADRVTGRRQHVAGGRQQHGARRRQLHAVAAAVQQPGADDLFQPMDLLAEGRLGDEQPLGGAGEGACVGDRDEVPQVPQLNTLRRLRARRRGPWHRLCSCLVHVSHLRPIRAGPCLRSDGPTTAGAFPASLRCA